MTTAATSRATGANGPAFTRFGAFVLISAGFALFLAMLYLIGAGEDFGGDEGGSQAHSASNGLNGYSGLFRLVEAEGFDAERSRSPGGLETDGLLVLTPSPYTEAEEIAEIIKDRTYRGPTLVIVPKWRAIAPMQFLPPEAREKFKRGWVMLLGAQPANWPEELPAPYKFRHEATGEQVPETPPPAKKPPPAKPGTWRGFGVSGSLPAAPTLYAEPLSPHDVLMTDGDGRKLAFAVNFARATNAGAEANEPIVAYNAQPVVFLVEPDIANNYGLADKTRAAAAMALVTQLADEADTDSVTFDMTLNGFGASENLLTLAFRPPFLAATLCLIAALLIVGWRAFQRFGPAAASGGPDIAFGKRQLITNGAGLILRARRFRLLAKPYALLSARRLAERMGLARPDPEAIDTALARRLPDEEPYTRRAARLEAASKPADILAAAKALDDLNRKLS
ncbi:DUF4350 domain-containing protein [Erythrobacter donghaensis]|uniref:DUF4350 domain-containing protein n=1 Tax=Erythrobacter donghaensis TaxID=267135 RepID=UPI000A399F2B|nr:DUF4350 domain-containing protein [Erythrobacter donghaensis]